MQMNKSKRRRRKERINSKRKMKEDEKRALTDRMKRVEG